MVGAVYVAEFETVLPPADCVVITVNVPQELPLQPGPLSAQDSTVLGFEPGTGVSVATIVADPPAGTLDGAESCNEKLLVMATAAEICFEGSATLCAVSVAVAGEGRVCGAAYFPLVSTVPHPPAHAGPERLQRIAVSGCPLLVIVAGNACDAPSSTLAELGVKPSVMSLVIAAVPVPDFVGSA